MGALGSEVTISRSEMLYELKKGAVSGAVFLSPSSFPWLKNLSKVFELWRPTRLQLEWRPAVSTSSSGTVAYGIDWAKPQLKEADAVDRASVLALTPVVDGPVWRTSRLNLPASILTSRKWFELSSDTYDSNTGPGSLAYSCTYDGAAGEFWVHYTVHFYGTNKA